MINLNTFKLYGVPKKDLESFVAENEVVSTISSVCNDYLVKFDFSSLSSQKIDQIIKDFLQKFSKHIYAESDISLVEQLIKILTLRKATVSVAESFTGGGISSLITSVSGASKVFLEGIIAYSNKAKTERLGVSEKTISTCYPVSSEVASEMCSGLLKHGASLAISTTGIAGPLSDESGYPVGLCYIAIASKTKLKVYKHKFSGSREEITKTGVSTAIFHAVMALRSGSFDV